MKLLPLQQLPQGSRWLYRGQNLVEKESVIDQLCAHANAEQLSYGLLSLKGALVSHLSLAENIWLPIGWRLPRRLGSVAHRARELLQCLGYNSDRASELLQSRYRDLTPLEAQAGILIRALILEPHLLIFDADWFARAQQQQQQPWQQTMAQLNGAAWIVVADAEQPLPSGNQWTSIAPGALLER